MRAARLIAWRRPLTTPAGRWRYLVVIACTLFVIGNPAMPASATSLSVTGHLNHAGAVRANGAGVELSITITCPASVNLNVQVTVQQALPRRRLTQATGGTNLHCGAGSGTYRVPAEVGQLPPFRTGDAVATLTGSCDSLRYSCNNFESERVVSLALLNLDKPTARAPQDKGLTTTLGTPGRIVGSGTSAVLPVSVACPADKTSNGGTLVLDQRTSLGTVQSADGSPPDFVCDGRPHTLRISVTPSLTRLHPGYAFIVLDLSECAAPPGSCPTLRAWRQVTLR
jgi:hypothetical protein